MDPPIYTDAAGSRTTDDGKANGRPPHLTRPQRELLAEIAATERGILYVRTYSRYGRTVQALLRKGMVSIAERDLSSMFMHGYSVTPQGRAALN